MKANHQFQSPAWSAAKVSIPYMILGLLWIYFTDRIGPSEGEQYIYYQTYKGFAYVLLSSLLIFVLVRIFVHNVYSSNKKYQLLFDKNPLSIWVFDNETYEFLEVNQKTCDTYGYTREELLKMSILEIRPPEEIPKIKEALRKMTSGVEEAGIWKHTNKNGDFLYVSGTVFPIKFNNRNATLAIARNVTRQYLIEQEKKKVVDQLVAQNQNLEQFAFIVSHNLRAPVAQIEGLVALFDKDDLQNPINTQIIDFLNKSTEKLDDIIKDLSITIRMKNTTGESWEPVDVKDLVESIKILFSKKLEEIQGKITFTSLTNDSQIKSIKGYIYSILLNLITNSIKYRRLDSPPVISITLDQNDNHWVIIVKDNGMGLNLDQVRQDLFGLYKRFHFHVEGKGIGLFLVKTQVEALGGRIQVNSKPYEGTTFTIILPSNSETAIDNTKVILTENFL
jgi:PAS domain S-box-containing protein